uniref:Uncharacterized protein n=1 Tax=Anguilla anguilla TaxID=7936 RepID=A0A0E9W207_ANGAN
MQGLYIQNNVTFQSTKVCRFSFQITRGEKCLWAFYRND